MIRFYLLLFTFTLLAIPYTDTAYSSITKERVVNSVRAQLRTYPRSTLQDIYKNFFQDYFGPGHLIPDSSMASNYLRKELNAYDSISGPLTELTGWQGNYYRVNLSVLKERKIPFDIFCQAFVASAGTTPIISPDAWPAEWRKIVKIIDDMGLNIAGYQADKQQLNEWLNKGEYVVHHSDTFNYYYQPHYRIVEKHIFEQQIQPYLQ